MINVHKPVQQRSVCYFLASSRLAHRHLIICQLKHILRAALIFKLKEPHTTERFCEATVAQHYCHAQHSSVLTLPCRHNPFLDFSFSDLLACNWNTGDTFICQHAVTFSSCCANMMRTSCLREPLPLSHSQFGACFCVCVRDRFLRTQQGSTALYTLFAQQLFFCHNGDKSPLLFYHIKYHSHLGHKFELWCQYTKLDFDYLMSDNVWPGFITRYQVLQRIRI